MGVTAIFGPSDPVLGAYIYSICDALDIPYLDAMEVSHVLPEQPTYFDSRDPQWKSSNSKNNVTKSSDGNSFQDSTDYNSDEINPVDVSTVPRSSKKNTARKFTIHLNPSQTLINTAFQDVMSFLNWTKVAIIYEKNHG